MACERFYVCGPWSSWYQRRFSPVCKALRARRSRHQRQLSGPALVSTWRCRPSWHHRGIGYQFGAQYLPATSTARKPTASAREPSRSSPWPVCSTGILQLRLARRCGGRLLERSLLLQCHALPDSSRIELCRDRQSSKFGVASTTRSRQADLTIDGITQTIQPITNVTGFYRWNSANGSQLRLKAGGCWRKLASACHAW